MKAHVLAPALILRAKSIDSVCKQSAESALFVMELSSKQRGSCSKGRPQNWEEHLVGGSEP